MTLQQFKQATIEQRSDAVWEWGFFVARSREGNKSKVLYSLNGFFAEMVISLADNSTESIEAFEKIDQLMQIRYAIAEDNPFIRSHKMAF